MTFTISSTTAQGTYNLLPSSPNGFLQDTATASRGVRSNVTETLAANDSITVGTAATAVPEPTSPAVMATGLLGVGVDGRRRSLRRMARTEC